jgi:putative transposase
MRTVREIAPTLSVAPTCAAFGVARSSYYRWLEPKGQRPRRRSVRALSDEERQAVLDVLHEERFVDQPPAQVWARLVDHDQRYLCSIRTMYRILASTAETRERRAVRRHPHYPVPQLVATRPNEVWSWDITKLPGPATWTSFHLYVILDIFSRFVVGWLAASRESKVLARRLIEVTSKRQGIHADSLTLHSDRGGPMISKPVALLLADLGVTKSHSRPRVSNDNPYSESHFKTMKYRPEMPSRFDSLDHVPACSVISSPGTTASTITRASGSSHGTRSITDSPRRRSNGARMSSRARTPNIPSGSRAVAPGRRRCRKKCGSTSRSRAQQR